MTAALRTRTKRLAARASAEIEALLARHEAGEISRQVLVALATGVLVRADAQAVTLADLALTEAATRQLRRVAVPLGLLPREERSAELAAGVRGVLDAEIESATTDEALAESRRARLVQLAEDVPPSAAVQAMRAGMAERGVRGWVRRTDVDPCKLCAGWADGVVRPPGTHMRRHKGCSCTQEPVFT